MNSWKRKLRMGMVGGGQGSFIGSVHRTAACLDNQAELVAGSFSRDPGNSNFADAISPVHTLGGIGASQPCLDTSAFAPPGPDRFGTAGRNTIRGPGLANYDMSVFRKFSVAERFKLEFRAEFYNLTNTPHFGSPVGSVNSAAFGRILSTLGLAGNRQVQMALRLTF